MEWQSFRARVKANWAEEGKVPTQVITLDTADLQVGQLVGLYHGWWKVLEPNSEAYTNS